MIEVNYNEYKETIAQNMKLVVENHDLKQEIERLKESEEYHKKGYAELHQRIDRAIEYIEERKNLNWYAEGVFVYELLNILQGSDKE